MKTSYIVFRSDASVGAGECDLPEEPGLDQINAVVRPLIRTLLTKHDHIEHVLVKVDGEYTDMFVDDEGQSKQLPRNERATTVYRNNWLTQHPQDDPESLPYIYGDAVLFSRRIWW